jgi:hypothetical protein
MLINNLLSVVSFTVAAEAKKYSELNYSYYSLCKYRADGQASQHPKLTGAIKTRTIEETIPFIRRISFRLGPNWPGVGASTYPARSIEEIQ